ncbi:MAG: PD-(D/E)XK nuclease family protein [archaeon]
MINLIKKVSFKHGWYYFYRVHQPKTEELCQSYPELCNYLEDMFENCPHEYFELEPRSSKLKFKLSNLNLIPANNHEVCELTKQGLIENEARYKSNHSKVQLFMLENDTNTIAIEVPLWLQPEEIEIYENLFQSKNPLTGHIDLIRIENNKIWIWDYKPNASREKYASTQVYFYALMLSKRTGIPLEKFRCGYFDSNDCYIFKPESHHLETNQLLITE